MISPLKSATNMESKSNLEDAFSQYIKLVMRKEIALAKHEIAKNVKQDTFKLTKSIAEELACLSEESTGKISLIENKVNEMRDNHLKSLDAMSDIFSKQMEQLETSVKQEIREATNKIFQSMSSQISKLNINLIKLSERVHNNEEILHNTRDDNGAISMILHDFANKISSKNNRLKEQAIDASKIESPFSAVQKRSPLSNNIHAS